MIDLMQAVQDAFFATLAAAVPDERSRVLVHVPQDTKPPFTRIGAIASDNEADKGDQLERFEVEVQSIYRGGDRGELLSVMHLVRAALDDVPLSAEGVEFGNPRFLGAAVSDATADGITYAGVMNFEVYAEPS